MLAGDSDTMPPLVEFIRGPGSLTVPFGASVRENGPVDSGVRDFSILGHLFISRDERWSSRLRIPGDQTHTLPDQLPPVPNHRFAVALMLRG